MASHLESLANLKDRLQRIEGRSFPAYKDLRGGYQGERFSLHIDHVQGDPFAAPSKLRIRVPMDEARLPDELHNEPVRRVALGDFLAREFRSAIPRTEAREVRDHNASSRRGGGGRHGSNRGARSGSGKSGLIRIDAGGQEVLERSALLITPDWVEARLEVGLPAAGRRILGRQAETLLLETLPAIAMRALFWENLDDERATHFVHCVENQEAVRSQLAELGLLAFVGNGAVLPRASGASDLPLEGPQVVPFQAPQELEVSIEIPNPIDTENVQSRILTGMGIPNGVTLIVGGGYHGKSTLLRALERCVYAHIPGDGREYVIAARDLVKVRAEDGRRVERVDIHSFISTLPGQRDTTSFCSEDASGSTSQAASIVEAIEAGCSGVLLDEDTSATNFMVRDARMQALVHKEFEPITPFLERIGELHENLGVSTVLVMGGCGDYFDVADHIIMLRDYRAQDVTKEAREISNTYSGTRSIEAVAPLAAPIKRAPLPRSFDPSRGRREIKIDAKGRDQILYGTDSIELRAVEQLVDPSQTRAIGFAILLASRRFMNAHTNLGEVLDRLDELFLHSGVDVLNPHSQEIGKHPGNFALPRRHEIAAAINRLRSLEIQ